jgi:hypothetical protein
MIDGLFLISLIDGYCLIVLISILIDIKNKVGTENIVFQHTTCARRGPRLYQRVHACRLIESPMLIFLYLFLDQLGLPASQRIDFLIFQLFSIGHHGTDVDVDPTFLIIFSISIHF